MVAAAAKPTLNVQNATVSGITAASGMRPLHTSGTNLVDDAGRAYRITGTALGGMAAVLQPDGTWNYPYRSITIAGTAHVGILDRLAAAGFNCVRLQICEDICYPGVKPMAYVNPTLNPDWYADPTNTATIIDAIQGLDLVVAYCGRLGLRVILEMAALAPNPNNVQACGGRWYTTSSRLAASTSPPTHTASDTRNEADWLNAWTAIAQRYAGNPVVIGADLINEPFNCTWGDGNLETDVCAAYTRCGNAIQQVAPNWLLFCEGIYDVMNFGPVNGGWIGVGWGAGLDGVAANPVTPGIANRVVYSPHEYGPGIGTWPYFNTANYPANMTAVWNQMYGYLVRNNTAPVYVGEMGDMLLAGANNGAETQDIYNRAVQWITLFMKYAAGQTTTGGQADVPPGSLGFSWSWFCWSTNGYSGSPGSVVNTNLLMGDFDTLNTNILQYLQPNLAPPMLTEVPVPVTLTLSAPAPTDVTLRWHTQNGTAIAPQHYVAGQGAVTIPAGQTSATITVLVEPLTSSCGGSLTFGIVVNQLAGAKPGQVNATVTIGYG